MKTEKCLVIIGAGGHGLVAEDIAKLSGYSKVLFLDDAEKTAAPTVGKTEDFVKYLPDADFFIAIGNSKIRQTLFQKLMEQNASVVSLIHPSATLAASAKVGKGVLIAAGAVINPCAVLEEGVIVNTHSSVDHECQVGAYSHIAVGAHLCGNVSVGKNCWIGAGAVVIQNLSIADGTTVGAGAVVVKAIEKADIFVGVPAKILPR